MRQIQEPRQTTLGRTNNIGDLVPITGSTNTLHFYSRIRRTCGSNTQTAQFEQVKEVLFCLQEIQVHQKVYQVYCSLGDVEIGRIISSKVVKELNVLVSARRFIGGTDPRPVLERAEHVKVPECPPSGRFSMMNGLKAANLLTIFELNPVWRSTSPIRNCIYNSPSWTNSDLMVSVVFWIKARYARCHEWTSSAFRLLADESLFVILSRMRNSSGGMNFPTLT